MRDADDFEASVRGVSSALDFGAGASSAVLPVGIRRTHRGWAGDLDHVLRGAGKQNRDGGDALRLLIELITFTLLRTLYYHMTCVNRT